MFKLPKCPYCKTIYHYKDVKKELMEKECTCYHCKKHFKSTLFPGGIILLLIVLFCAIGFNFFILSFISKLSFLEIIIMLVITIIFLVIGYLLYPLFVSFIKTETNSDKLNWRV